MQATFVRESEHVAIAPVPTASVDGAELVELVGHLDGELAGFVCLFEEPARVGRYVKIGIEDIVHLFREDTGVPQTVIMVPGEAQILMCTPVAASNLGVEVPTVDRPWPRR